MFFFLVLGACFPASLAFLGLTGSLLAGVLLGVSLEACLLGLFPSPSSLVAPPESWRGSLWFVAFLLVRELGSILGSTPGGGEGVGGILLGLFVAPPDLPCPGLGSAPDSPSEGGEGVGELLLGFLVAPPGLPCSGLDPTLDSTGTSGEGAGELLPDLLVAPPDLPCPELDPVLNLTPCEGEGVCEHSWGPPEAFPGPPWAGLDSSLDSNF